MPPPQPIEKTLNLTVSNFGPIIEAEIDLRPITVFAGPSNTGKSYMATLIYALQRFFSNNYTTGPASFNFRYIPVMDASDIPDDALNDLVAWQEHIARNSEPKALPKSVESLFLQVLDISEYYGPVVIDEMMRCFGKDSPGLLTRHGSGSEAKIAIKSSVAGGLASAMSLQYKISVVENQGDMLRASIPESLPLEVANRAASYYRHDHLALPGSIRMRRINAERMLNALAKAVDEEFIAPLSNPVHYLPADRTGIMHAHQVVVASLISRASRAGLRRDAPLPVLSGVLADFLENLITLGESRRRPRPDSDYRKTARRIEDRMLEGAVQVSKSATGYPEFHYRPKGWKETLPLMSSASMVSELAPVILYLRHVVAPGDTLIIEEPESHLHPAMQVEFIRQLAAVALAGVRVIITTHSEWVLDELGNLAQLSLLPKSNRDGVPGADFALKPEDVGVWLFRPQTRPVGSVVEEIPFGEEFGGYSADFNDIALETYNSHAEISNRIEEARNP